MIFSNITPRAATMAHFKITVMLKFFLTSQQKTLYKNKFLCLYPTPRIAFATLKK